jgi:hypothetical protein
LAISTKPPDIKSDQEILEKAKFYNSIGYNVHPILRPEQKGQKWNAAQNRWEEVTGDGKKAEGTGAWTESQIKKQSKADVEELFSKYGQYNIALIQGKVSECEFVIDKTESKPMKYFKKQLIHCQCHLLGKYTVACLLRQVVAGVFIFTYGMIQKISPTG